jgi:hypothetical protein
MVKKVRKLNLEKTTLKSLKVKSHVLAGSTCVTGQETAWTENKGKCVVLTE